MLDSVLVVEDGAASESKSGNIVLKSAVDEKEEDAKGSHRNQSQGITWELFPNVSVLVFRLV